MGKVPTAKSEDWNLALETNTVQERADSHKLLSDLHKLNAMEGTWLLPPQTQKCKSFLKSSQKLTEMKKKGKVYN